jgi:hypothetical protein
MVTVDHSPSPPAQSKWSIFRLFASSLLFMLVFRCEAEFGADTACVVYEGICTAYHPQPQAGRRARRSVREPPTMRGLAARHGFVWIDVSVTGERSAMDAHRVDLLIRSLRATPSRRSVVWALTVGGLGLRAR